MTASGNLSRCVFLLVMSYVSWLFAARCLAAVNLPDHAVTPSRILMSFIDESYICFSNSMYTSLFALLGSYLMASMAGAAGGKAFFASVRGLISKI